MTARTVRDVLVEYLGPDVANVLAELKAVLSTGDQWVAREIEAQHVVAGDVLRAKNGELWAVTSTAPDDTAVIITTTRGERDRAITFDGDRPIPVLLTRTDARALALLERELGASTVGRGVE